MPPERLGRRKRSSIARKAMIGGNPLEEVLQFVCLREKHGLVEPRHHGTVGERVVDEVRRRLLPFAHVGNLHDVVGKRLVLRLRHLNVQLDQRTEDGHRRNACPRARLVDRHVHALHLGDELVHHLLGGFQALLVARRAVKLHERPHRVFLAPDVEAPVLLVVGRIGICTQQILVRVRREVAVWMLVGVDEMVGLLHAPGGELRVSRVAYRPCVAEHRLAPVFALPAAVAPVGIRVVPMRREGVLRLVVHGTLRVFGEHTAVQRRLEELSWASKHLDVAGRGRRQRIAEKRRACKRQRKKQLNPPNSDTDHVVRSVLHVGTSSKKDLSTKSRLLETVLSA